MQMYGNSNRTVTNANVRVKQACLWLLPPEIKPKTRVKILTGNVILVVTNCSLFNVHIRALRIYEECSGCEVFET